MCALDPGKESAPAMLVGMAVFHQEASYFLDLLLCLPIGLWVITSKEAHVHCQEGEKGTPDSGDKLGSTVRYIRCTFRTALHEAVWTKLP